MREHPLKSIVRLQKEGKAIGIYSACTANELVLRACMQRAKETDSVLLIEATANQVDQYGGYTGMKPKDFMKFVGELAVKEDISMDRIILGGDHLGPLTFTKYDEAKAMSEASELIRQFVLAGFTKIHIDTSMKVASDDPDVRLSDEVISRRGAELASVAETAYAELLKENPDAIHPVYIVGSEVPIPGGSQSKQDTGLQVTKVEDFKKTVATFEKSFHDHGLDEAWSHVIGVVVQPGVEEKDAGCTEYDRSKAVDLMASIKAYDNLVFEGHSTDYQTKIKLRELVEDGVGILKVGPGLTYAMREGLFALAYAEKEQYKDEPEKQSHFMEVLDEAMVKEPKYFAHHYYGTPAEIAFKRKFSFSDRCRYYLPQPEVEAAQAKLFANFKDGVPYGLLSQFMPIAYTKVREGKLNNDPVSLVKDRVINTVNEYLYASHQEEIKD
ncbi:MAG: class II D-tagatose-bisphosphate aldolase, non-catalytic subunit [Solobacterium sp.]|jgi:D-tagatose-1,6-bisphosphate aldolase subunit GatZ/KbaZ|nr:class II D-tagatose-bisphosphate aldolase, non-catalytic subunit [Solobacterium sp.]MCH4221830.1 class II D-tagatose-bisphosphate aldolase, non-catalytic subunit [Solobacterium sp.]MCH4265052.1 class II D-tagatose-bisphosphate aldolase, non-catalytic subunit [Solobacterium sp.]